MNALSAIPRPVVGLDTATNRWHAIANAATELRPEHYCSKLKGVEWEKGDDAADRRRGYLVATWHQFVVQLPIGTIVLCEEPLALQNGKTTRLLSLACGALWSVTNHVRPDIDWRWADVSHWKRVVVGNGNADKLKIRDWVLVHAGNLDMTNWDQQEDLYDAYCLLQYANQWLTTDVKPVILKKSGKSKKRSKK